MMSEYSKTVDKFEFSPWTSPPYPHSSIRNGIIATVPDISLLQNDDKSLSTNKNITNACNSTETQNYHYPNDTRFKFYQILQSRTNNVDKKIKLTGHRDVSSRNHIIAMETKNKLIPTAYKRHSSIQTDNLSKQYCQYDKEKDNVKTYCHSDRKPYSVYTYENNQCNDNNSVNKLFTLIDEQGQQLDLIKLQINTLLANLNRFQYKKIKTSSNLNDNEMKLFESLKLEREKKCDERPHVTSNKVSIGVMTSFEFILQSNWNKYNGDVISKMNNPLFPDAICEVEQSNGENKNSLNDIMHEIIERSACEILMQNNGHKINSNNDKLDHYSVEKVDHSSVSSVNESVRTSTKIGWTFYNNVLCHVDEILRNSNDIESSKISCNAAQLSNSQHIKAFTNMTNAITPNISNKTITFDMSNYPRVNYQNNIIQMSNSISDANASIHMRALALKYFGDKQLTRDNILQLNKPMNILNKTNSMYDNILENNMSLSTRNYMDKHKLITNDPSLIIDNVTVEKQNVLDISILKRQPKLL